MKLQEFLEYKQNCPICDNPLKFFFHSRKWQKVRYEEDRLLILFRLDGIKKGQGDYRVGYSFGLKDNSWFIDFYTEQEKRYDYHAPDFLRLRFRQLDSNQGLYKFTKSCRLCDRYSYSSNYFQLDFRSPVLADLSVETEYFGLSQKLEEDLYRNCKLVNNYTLNTSTISYAKDRSPVWVRQDSSLPDPIEVSGVIKFSSNEETLSRINKLIVFS